MLTRTRRPPDLGLVLQPDDCLELLKACTAGSLACTSRALPLVVPVLLKVVGTSVWLVMGDHSDPDRFAGHVVALGAGVPPTPRSDGWWVLVRGEVQAQQGPRTGLVLDTMDIEGRLLPATGGGW